jgi:putative transposase
MNGRPNAPKIRKPFQLIDFFSGLPRVDNGPEYINGKLVIWAKKLGITIQHIQPGQPQQNAYIERYNSTVRHEWLDQYIIDTIEEAQDHATQCLRTYNNDCPTWASAASFPHRN